MLADGKLQALLERWQQEGEHFTGAIFITRGERREERYDPETDVWETKKLIDGDAGLIFKTERQGTLLIELTEKGFHWARGTSYRFGGVAPFRISESSTKRILPKKLLNLLVEQTSQAYAPGSTYDYASFAYRIYVELSKNDGVLLLEKNSLQRENCILDAGRIRLLSNIRSLKADDMIVSYSEREDTLFIYDHQVNHRLNEPEAIVELNKSVPVYVKLELEAADKAPGEKAAPKAAGVRGGVTSYISTQKAPKPKGDAPPA